MAATTEDQVTVVAEHFIGAAAKPRAQVMKLVQIALVAQGTNGNKISAASLGLSEVYSVSNITEDDDTPYTGLVLYDRSGIVIVDYAGAEQDLTASVQMQVTGVPA